MSLNFVAAEDGLEEDPKVLTLARLLKKPRAFAFWYVMRWRRLIVNAGNAITGALPKSYTAADVAAFLEWEGKPAALLAAMKSTGFLGGRRERGLFYPAWSRTTTGHYASVREEERLRKERERRKRRAEEENRKNGTPHDADGPGTVRGQGSDASADSPRTGEGNPTLIKEGTSADGPPGPPPPGGDLGTQRWLWLKEWAPTPQNDDVCRPILAAMSAEDWELVQKAYRRARAARTGMGPPLSKKEKCVTWPTHKFLRDKTWQRFYEQRPAIRQETAGRVTVDPLEKAEKQRLERDRFLRELFLDPEVPQEKKDAERSAWLSDPENADRVPPWKNPTPANGHAKQERPS